MLCVINDFKIVRLKFLPLFTWSEESFSPMDKVVLPSRTKHRKKEGSREEVMRCNYTHNQRQQVGELQAQRPHWLRPTLNKDDKQEKKIVRKESEGFDSKADVSF